MKKLFLLFSMVSIGILKSQFTITITPPDHCKDLEAYLYALNGSKDMILSKSLRQNKENWVFEVSKPYIGKMKIYFPKTNNSISLIAENKAVKISFTTLQDKIQSVEYLDDANQLFSAIQDQQKKKEQILPALYQIQNYYNNASDFGVALKKEIEHLDTPIPYEAKSHPFVDYYYQNYNKFISTSAGKVDPTNDEIIQFLNTSQQYLESSSLLKPILMVFLSSTSKSNVGDEIDKLLKTVDVETPRGQTILSELIEIFTLYNISDLREKYLSLAKNLKCTINERLGKTLTSSLNTSIGNIIPNTFFVKPSHTKAKSLHEVKADKKVIIVWSSTCPHCEKEISEMFSKYALLKAQNIEVIGFSLDTDFVSYSEKAKLLPWINDTELKGWYSSYVDAYNVQATPTFYVVDSKNKILATPDHFAGVLDFLGIK